MNETADSESPTPSGPSRTPSLLRRIFMNPREPRAGWRMLVYVVLAFLIMGILDISAVWLHFPLPLPHKIDAIGLLLQEVISAVGVFGAALIMARPEHRSIGVYGLPGRHAFGRHFWQGVLWGIVMISVVILLIWTCGGFSFGKIDLSGAGIARYAFLWGAVFLMTGFFEEFTFRGYTQFTLATGIGFWPAAIILSAGFASAHIFNPGEGLVGALSVFVIAIFFCITLWRTGNLWFAVGLHAAWDWGETFLYSVPNSGFVAPGHLLHSSLHGPRWLSGGTVGPEGSVFAFLIVGVASVLFLWLYRKPTAAVPAARP